MLIMELTSLMRHDFYKLFSSLFHTGENVKKKSYITREIYYLIFKIKTLHIILYLLFSWKNYVILMN